jgi:hypothetical protein
MGIGEISSLDEALAVIGRPAFMDEAARRTTDEEGR